MTTRLLVADGDREIRELFALVLRGAGFEVDAVADGGQALHAARTGAPALVIADADLPGLSGPELCRALRRDPATRAVPVIVVNTHGRLSAAGAARAAGAGEYLVKPCHPARLVERVRTVLARRTATRPAGELVAG
jgi:DNA-binding response OmpR family regulator